MAQQVGVRLACRALPGSVARYYRQRQPQSLPPAGESAGADTSRKAQGPAGRALTSEERAALLEVLHTERFGDAAPREVYATLLSEGLYYASVSTMYRVLADRQESGERRTQLRHGNFVRPELLATGANQLWSWDITKLKAASKWTYYYLYVVLDVFSRYVVAWCLAPCENAALAQKLILDACLRHKIAPGQLTLHADRGTAMTSKVVEQLLVDLSVTKTHSRPHVSNDNPYSEAHFKTLKYRPAFPACFGSQEDAQSFCETFFGWYNTQHQHSGIAWLTPEIVHAGRAAEEIARREAVLAAAYAAHPTRFVKHPPKHPALPAAVWINPPVKEPASAVADAAELQ